MQHQNRKMQFMDNCQLIENCDNLMNGSNACILDDEIEFSLGMGTEYESTLNEEWRGRKL